MDGGSPEASVEPAREDRSHAAERAERPASYAAAADTDLIASYQQTGDAYALAELVRRYLPFARGLARRYAHTSEPLDDLAQVAAVGLVAAINRYDPAYGRPLRAFAAPTILGELRRHFRDSAWTVRVPRPVQERARELSRAFDDLSGQLGRSPTLGELAGALNLTVEDVLEGLEARYAYQPRSLDAPYDDEDGDRSRLSDLGSEDAGFARAESAVVLSRAFESLTPREQTIVRLRFEEDLSQSEIGARLGISQMHVSRLLRRALDRMSVVIRAG